MKKLFLLIFLASCTLPNNNNNYNDDNLNINFNENLTFDEFNELLKKYNKSSAYPDIDK